MYHYVRDVDPTTDELGYNLSIAPDLFEEHLAWLAENDYTPVRMDTLTECLRGWRECPDNPVALTFDDGYVDAATEALPLLQRFGFTATFYIVTDFVGRPGYMTWDDIRNLQANGMEIGSHTLSHPDLTYYDPEVVYDEIVLSRVIIQRKLGAPVHSFCYPLGRYDESYMPELVREAGYTNAVTTYPGFEMGPFYELPRRRILGGEGAEAIAWYVSQPQ